MNYISKLIISLYVILNVVGCLSSTILIYNTEDCEKNMIILIFDFVFYLMAIFCMTGLCFIYTNSKNEENEMVNEYSPINVLDKNTNISMNSKKFKYTNYPYYYIYFIMCRTEISIYN